MSAMTGNGEHTHMYIYIYSTTCKSGDDLRGGANGMVLPTWHLIIHEVIIASWSGKQLLARAEGPKGVVVVFRVAVVEIWDAWLEQNCEIMDINGYIMENHGKIIETAALAQIIHGNDTQEWLMANLCRFGWEFNHYGHLHIVSSQCSA